MKQITILACALLAFAACNAASAQVVENQDRFTGTTTFKYESKLSAPTTQYTLMPPSLIIHASFEPDKQPAYSLMVITSNMTGRGRGGSGSGWKYLGVESIDWLVDGKPVEISPPRTNRSVQRGFVVETFVQDFTKEQFAQLSNANTVEFRISPDEFSLTPVDIAGIKSLLESKPTE